MKRLHRLGRHLHRLTALPTLLGLTWSQPALAGEPRSSSPPKNTQATVVAERANPWDPDPGTRWQKKLAIQAQVGLATPLGALGLSLEYAPVEEFTLSAGVGLGSGPYCLSPEDQPQAYDEVCKRWHRDLQYAVLGRVRFPIEGPLATGFGAGPSMGGYTWVEPLQFDGPAYKSTERAYWGNLELFVEGRSEAGWTGRFFVGYGFMLNPSDLPCVDWGAGNRAADHCAEDHAGDGHGLLYFGFSGGFAL
ncbi:MAG: hypothetical protein H6716_25375 [Polyangiaceae bacterium]|nr:hypothetical protein [Polyangiaceae bacterium]